MDEDEDEDEINQEILKVMKVINKYRILDSSKSYHYIIPLADFDGIPDFRLILYNKLQYEFILTVRQTPQGDLGIEEYGKYMGYIIDIVPSAFEKYYASISKSINTKGKKPVTYELSFDSDQSRLTCRGMTCDVPRNSLEYFTCKLVFKSPTSPVEETDIMDEAEKGDQSKRPIYDAVVRINKKAKEAFGIDKILDFRAGMVSLIYTNR